MKRVISFLIVFIMFFSAFVFTQTEEMNCITNYTETNWNGQIGGLYLPAEGIIGQSIKEFKALGTLNLNYYQYLKC